MGLGGQGLRLAAITPRLQEEEEDCEVGGRALFLLHLVGAMKEDQAQSKPA